MGIIGYNVLIGYYGIMGVRIECKAVLWLIVRWVYYNVM